MTDLAFDAALDAHQARLYEEAQEAQERSWYVAARPDADPVKTSFAELRVGDYMTADGVRWVKIIDLRGPHCYVRSKQQAAPDGDLSVMFEIPEAVHHSGERHYWIDRPPDEVVVVDARIRADDPPEPEDESE